MADIAVNLEPSPQVPIDQDRSSLTQWQLTWRRFLRNRLAVAGGIILIIFYVVMVIFPGFFSPYSHVVQREDFMSAPPQLPRWVDENGTFHWRPFVYGFTTELDMEKFEWVHTIDTSQKYPIYFIVRGELYRLLGFIPCEIHIFGVEPPGTFFLFGTDELGRDLFSRILHGGQVSLTVGLVGVILTIILGSVMGTISGYYGGIIDNLIQRLVELLMSFPDIPLWAALSAALPPEWSPAKRFFAISAILSLRNWTGLARQVRAKILAYREEDYALAAQAMGASDRRIILVHLLPNAASHIIVVATLSIPGMILAETALSFLGLGIQPPVVSWGVLLQHAQEVAVVLDRPWLLLPGVFVVLAVLSFNFLGDGLRDAADPYSN
ncbi:MAG: ABC transporter permease [Firmicutes bacterium]|jgi:peptide/nickel transport system permease protein|nr:ABC transporter permease [Bacillota bacterium]